MIDQSRNITNSPGVANVTILMEDDGLDFPTCGNGTGHDSDHTGIEIGGGGGICVDIGRLRGG